MLCAIHTPLSFNLHAISENGVVHVGREADNQVRLDSPAVPYLLSRHHATLTFRADGGITLTDLTSTNGTYVSRNGTTFRRLQHPRTASSSDDNERPAPASWHLQTNDIIGFGGPDTIVADGGEHVPNPFMFRYRPRIIYEPPMSPDQVMSDQQLADNDDNEDEADQGSEAIDSDSDAPSPSGCSPSTSGRDDDAADYGASAAVPPCLPGGALAPLALPRSRRGTHDGSGFDSLAPLTTSGPHSRVTDIVAKHLTCAICQELLLASHMLPCGHMFCGLCLAKWLAVSERHSCPSCRKPVAALPVRCFQVDNTISELLDSGGDMMSPGARLDRRRKQRHWEDIQRLVEQDWQACLQPKRHSRSHPHAAPVPPILVGAMVEPRNMAHLRAAINPDIAPVGVAAEAVAGAHGAPAAFPGHALAPRVAVGGNHAFAAGGQNNPAAAGRQGVNPPPPQGSTFSPAIVGRVLANEHAWNSLSPPIAVADARR